MDEKGIIPSTRAQQSRTAVRVLTEVLGQDEPLDDARWVLDHIDELADRYAIKNSANADTTRTYRSKAASILTAYFQFLENPRSRPKVAAPRRVTPKRVEEDATAANPQPNDRDLPPGAAPTEQGLHRLRLAEGRYVEFRSPEDVTTREVRRIAFHLASFAEVFDPGSVGAAGLTRIE
jgi:hypothetical protein